MFVREHVALLLHCHDFVGRDTIDCYTQLRSKEGSGTCCGLLRCHYFVKRNDIDCYAQLRSKEDSGIGGTPSFCYYHFDKREAIDCYSNYDYR